MLEVTKVAPRQAIENLGTAFQHFFRQVFADQWYDLHDPDQTETPMVVRSEARRENFLLNFDELRIQQVVLAFSQADEAPFEVPVAHLRVLLVQSATVRPRTRASSAPVEAMRQDGCR
jgi:hypothetical protein